MPDHPIMEFHVARTARDYYQFDDVLFASNGNAVLANFHAARLFAQRMNDRRDLLRFPEQAVAASQINAMGLLDEIGHLLVARYRAERNPRVMADALAWLDERVGEDAVRDALRQFCTEFPPLAVYRGQQSVADYLAGSSGGVSHWEATLEELIFLGLSNQNPALVPYRELFDDDSLARRTAYRPVMRQLEAFFATQPAIGPDNQSLLDMLLAPARRFPHSLTDQLEFVRSRYGPLLGDILYRLLSSLDLIAEESRVYFGTGGPGPAQVIDFSAQLAGDLEYEQFSPDQEWMPRLVLVAKNAYVWLDQLSKRHERAISRLDQIPDEELDRLARYGFSGLWLIGLWERSEASREIKHRCGNPDAVASAYSLFDYAIAAQLGGDEAYENLRRRAAQRGVRLASDMVPNHMGIDSRWVVEHPDWFLSLPYSPYPSYTFNGPDLSRDERVGIFLEDHYYSRSDAAVVFKRVDRWTGDTRYIYHGNDGTSMPWNDTAQLDFLRPEVREAVIQTILHVARKSSVIRFDAAMVLAKKHIHRLWWPAPGTGGGIPSRSEFGLSKEQLDERMPHEFWREVVDRVAEEVPDTLLLAEAFWLMEGYFVRTLGMHRVYNSAFMHMLRDEKNAEYRLVMKNTIEFNPEILKRYVNFMSNPDEETAVEQFGKGDKYFGVATLMATLPGLPMVGHGQIEGFTEKYGMEYQRAYYEEQPDGYLVERHEREIFPLFHRRALFADVEDFLLFDFFAADGTVIEDVFAYSNRHGDERSLVIYHNRWATAAGWINRSAAYSVSTGPGPDDRALVQRTLAEGLDIPDDPGAYLLFRDQVSGLEFVRNCQTLNQQGLYIELGAYKCHVFLDFRVVQEQAGGEYARLHDFLNGRGVPDIETARQELLLAPLREPFRALANADLVRGLQEATGQTVDERETIVAEIADRYAAVLVAIQAHLADTEPADTEPAGTEPADTEPAGTEPAGTEPAGIEPADAEPAGTEPADTEPADMEPAAAGPSSIPVADRDPVVGLTDRLRAQLTRLLDLATEPVPGAPDRAPAGIDIAPALPGSQPGDWGRACGWLFCHALGRLAGGPGSAQPVVDDPATAAMRSRSWIDEWLLGSVLVDMWRELGLDPAQAQQALSLVRLLTTHQNWYRLSPLSAYRLLSTLLRDNDARQFLQINRYQDVLWFNREAFAALGRWLELVARLGEAGDAPEEAPALAEGRAVLATLAAAAAVSEYQVEKLLEAAEPGRQ